MEKQLFVSYVEIKTYNTRFKKEDLDTLIQALPANERDYLIEIYKTKKDENDITIKRKTTYWFYDPHTKELKELSKEKYKKTFR